MKRNLLERITAAIFVYSLLLLSLAPISIPAQAPAQDKDLDARLLKLEERFEKRRKELGIPGMSIAIVKDGRVVLSKGYGFKDFEKKVPMTADTQLAIGSATKAFTGLSAVMLEDQGKLSLDNPPSKYLPYFKINNTETQEKIKVRDLMTHASGLNRTDLAMITGQLNRVELIKVAGEAKPMAGLGERFFYQNIMFAAAGEIVASVYGKPWEEFVPKEIFKPLGMTNSTMTTKEFKKAKDISKGYIYNFDTKETKSLPKRDISHIGPAGSINSSSNDMAKWLQFLLNEGKVGEKNLISKKAFDEWTTGHMNVAPNGSIKYGLGWFVENWNEKKIIHHGGNIDGFSSMVAFMPEEKLGLVMLSNVSASSLQTEIRTMVFEEIIGGNEIEKAGPEQQKEVGIYVFKEAGFDIDITIEDGFFVAKVPGQPTYKLKKVGDRKYALANAPAGFFVTFKDTEAFLEQPQGNFTLKRKGAASNTEDGDEVLKSLIGTYEPKVEVPITLEIAEKEGKISLIAPGQPPYPLKMVSEDKYGSPSLPETYFLTVNRDADKKIVGITMNQPEGSFEFTKSKGKDAALPDGKDLVAKIIEAGGGEENMRAIKTRRTEYEVDAVHQGVKGTGVLLASAPNKSRSETKLIALGKEIGWTKEVFDGEKGFEDTSFSESDNLTGKRLIDASFSLSLFPFLDLDERAEKVETIRRQKIGERDAFILRIVPKGGSEILYFVDVNDFTVFRRISTVVSSTSEMNVRISEVYSDFREVDGVMLAFKVVSTNPNMGDIVTTVKKIEHNVDLSKDTFDTK